MRLKMKNIFIMGFHQFLEQKGGRGLKKTQYIGGNALKQGLDNLQGASQKIGWRVFLRES